MARYCKRRRKMPVITGRDASGAATLGAPVPALITRYRFGARRKKPHYVYYHGGTWYRARNAVTALDDAGKPCAWEWALEPIASCDAYDAHLSQTVADGKAAPVGLRIEGGRVAKATGCKGTPYEGLTLLDGAEDSGYIEKLLDLAPSARTVKQDTPAYRGKHFKSA